MTNEQDHHSTPVGHTPGPWSIGSVKNGRGYRDELMVYAPNGDLIANFEAPKQPSNPLRFIRSPKEDRCNALIGAAGPAMLEALTWAVEWMNAYDGMVMTEWREWADRAGRILAAAQAHGGTAL